MLDSSPIRPAGTDRPLQDRRWGELGLHGYAKIAILAALFCFLFRGELRDAVHLWLTDPSWSHGFLIPLFSLYFINQRRRWHPSDHIHRNNFKLAFSSTLISAITGTLSLLF